MPRCWSMIATRNSPIRPRSCVASSWPSMRCCENSQVQTPEHSRSMRNLDGEMRQRPEPGEPGTVILGSTRVAGNDRNDGPQMPRSEAPEMEIGELVTVDLDFRAQLVGHGLVGIHIEQNSAGIADQAI